MSNSLDNIILAFALKDKKHTMELINSVDEKYFEENKWIFKTIKSHFNDPRFKEIPSEAVVSEKLSSEPFSDQEKKDFLNTFSELVDDSIKLNSSDFTWHLEKLRTRYNTKLQKECAQGISKVLSSESDDEEKKEKVNKLIKETTTNIDSIYKKQVYKEGAIGDSARERFDKYKYIEQHPEAAQGILTGFKDFDRISNGLHPGEFMIIAGDTGTGKSVVMHNIGVNAYVGKNNPLLGAHNIRKDTGHNVLYFSLEMPKESVERRIDSCMGSVIYNELRDGHLSKEDKQKYFNALKFQMAHDKQFYVVDIPKGATTREIELKYLEITESKFKPDLVIIDYIGIMSANDGVSAESDWLSIGKISAELHEFARFYNIPVITGSQVNRPKEGNAKQEYSTNRIARSGMATTNANIIVQIGNREDEALRSDIQFFITKMRDGEKTSFTMSKDFARMKIMDIDAEPLCSDASLDDVI